MMGLQLIFVVETDKNKKTDYIYIRSVLEYCYNALTNPEIKVSAVYMDGKGNYSQGFVTTRIKELKEEYSLIGESIVIYCFDTDDYDINQDDKVFLDKVETYTKNNGYELVWFCHDVEEVFLGKRISDSEKVKEAQAYVRKHLIDKITLSNLKSNSKTKFKSNIMTVLDKHLIK